MAILRSELRATTTVIVLIPLIYLVFVITGFDSGTAGMWALGIAAGLSAIALTTFTRTSSALTMPDDVNRSRALRHAAVILVLLLLTESTMAGLLAGYSPVSATDGPHSHPVHLRNALNTTLGLPVFVLLAFWLGVRSSRRLTGPYPLVWLAAVALSSRAIRLLLYRPAVQFSRPRDVAIHSWEYTLVRNLMIAILIFCLLALGNRYGRRRTANNGP